ncbi:hypothetical protein [Rubrimonas cliftonensis]|uniref:Uncharacterized protein n=1 Tax=Rubrimonas cliftonensis TaxID=89524 RepID=A0A1H3YZQ6_9RHOB|nr:hypothetical protein [Rubrimonas cliftonensis]SEA16995.1 hypothetical protein SAMN05444370_103322 [Rubrimonas cliftonensis]
MSNDTLAAIRRDGATLALAARQLLALRCAQADGADGAALAHALADMMQDGEYPHGWPLAKTIELIDVAGIDRCARTAALRGRLFDLAERLALVEDDDEEPAAAA